MFLRAASRTALLCAPKHTTGALILARQATSSTTIVSDITTILNTQEEQQKPKRVEQPPTAEDENLIKLLNDGKLGLEEGEEEDTDQGAGLRDTPVVVAGKGRRELRLGDDEDEAEEDEEDEAEEDIVNALQPNAGEEMEEAEEAGPFDDLYFDNDTERADTAEQAPEDMMDELEYFQYYPSRIQKWVSYARMPKGFYNDDGYWQNDPVAMKAENYKRNELKDLNREKQMKKEVLEERERKIKDNPLPVDLVGKYRFGVLPEETVDLNPRFKEWLSFRNANKHEINQYRRQEVIKKYQQKPYDTGSAGVQIAVLTTRINYLTEHCEKHRSDISSKLGLRDLINKRFRLMKYCKRKNVPLYYQICKDLNVKDMAP
jgi:small subunit ribosomal protein S15